MNFKKGISLALTVTLLGTSTLALAEGGKEEVIYAVLNGQGQVDGLYAVNIFDGGEIVDYGDYTSVHPLNTEDEISYENGEVRFQSDAQRVYYQGNLNTKDLPWLFALTYRLDGQPVEAEKLAGKNGHVEIELKIRRNPDYQGELFRSHALQITAALDTEKCRNIVAEGATLANVGTSRQLSYIVLPNTEKDILISADAADFEMDAISINGVRLSLAIDVDDSELSEETDKLVDAGEELDDGAQELLDGAAELTDHNEELLDGARQIVDAVFETANETLQESKDEFDALGIELRTLTIDNYSDEIERLQSELLDKVDDYVRRKADQQLAGMVQTAARQQVEAAVREAARQQVEEKVTEAAREQVSQKVLAGGEEQVRAAVEAAARQQIRPQVEAAARQKIRNEIVNLSDEQIQALVEQQMQSAEVQAQIDAAVTEQMSSQQVQDRIASEIETQMASDDVQKKIDEETAAQLASTDTQTLLQNLIDQQMASDEVQQLIAQNVKEQMASGEVQNLIDQNIESQMASEQVRSRISAEMANQRQSRQYLDSVAEALEEKGENGEAYRALSDLRDTLDDVQKFYDGLKDYTDGVNELRDGAQEMKDGTEEFRSETAGINDTLNEKIDDMIAEKTGSDVALSSFVDPRNTDVDNVQFVITTPAVRAASVQNEEETVPEETGVLEKIRNLFR